MERAVQTMDGSRNEEHDEESCVRCLDDEVVRNRRSDQRSRGTVIMAFSDPTGVDIAQVDQIF